VSGAASTKSRGARLTQLAALVVIFGLLLALTRLVPEARAAVGTVAGLGFLLLAGTLTSEIAETVAVPHLLGYLVAGVVSGPYVLHLVDHETVERLAPVDTMALCLISLAGGAELKIGVLRETARSLTWAMATQTGIVFVVGTASYFALTHFVAIGEPLPLAASVGVALLWGALAITRSPAALLGIFAQTHAKGPVATFSLAFVMLSNVVGVLVAASTIVLVRPLVDPLTGLSLNDITELSRQVVGSIALGTTLGLVLSAYLRVVGGKLLVVLVAMGLGLSELLRYIQFDAMLTFLVAGFVVTNLSEQGPKLLSAVERTGAIVYVVFFALTGAHIDLPLLLRLWPVALALCAARGLATWGAARLASRQAGDVPAVRRWGFSGLVSQAGLALGLALVILRAYPRIGDIFRSLVIATVSINEVVGPVLFKLGLDRAGETRANAAVLPAAQDSGAPT
jgi:Kef-type K+ transport system membrane component KefB